MSKNESTPQGTLQRNTVRWLVILIAVSVFLLLFNFVYFFTFNAANWTPAPTYTSTYNSTQNAEQTALAGSRTPTATAGASAASGGTPGNLLPGAGSNPGPGEQRSQGTQASIGTPTAAPSPTRTAVTLSPTAITATASLAPADQRATNTPAQ